MTHRTSKVKERSMTRDLGMAIAIAAVSLVLLAGTALTPASAAGPRVNDGDNTWPGMSKPDIAGGFVTTDRPDAAAVCDIYATYCYYNGRVALPNTGRNQ
jgi:hypothetical protein